MFYLLVYILELWFEINCKFEYMFSMHARILLYLWWKTSLPYCICLQAYNLKLYVL
jgi:hypothetical protein